jgi:tRNA threonylcarbamoyladenosine biosynthesis protein TsaE
MTSRITDAAVELKRMTEEHFLETPAALEAFGETLPGRVGRGAVILLVGEMGAGKTTLTKGIARGLNSSAEVTSPTYNLIHEYPTPDGKLIHIDAHRLERPQKLWRMGLDEFLDTARLIVIEWGLELRPELEKPVLILIRASKKGRTLNLEQD